MAAYVFLGINGWDLQAPEPEAVHFLLGLSTKRINEAQFADWLRQSSAQLSKRGRAGKKATRTRSGTKRRKK